MKPGRLAWPEGRTRCAHPGFAAVRAALDRLPQAAWPTLSDLNGLLGDRANIRGHGVHFMAPAADEVAGQHYELRIARTGAVATRDNWHDLFNALSWVTYPRTKCAISDMHARIIESRGADELKQRSVERDVLTLFDEGGLVVVSESSALLQLLRDFQWKSVLWDQRAAWLREVRVFVFGHGLLEKLLAPHLGMTAKCLALLVPEGWIGATSHAAQLQAVDAHCAAFFADAEHLHSTRALHPLPVLGIPGWDTRGEQADFYDDHRYFRSGYSRAGR